MYNVLRLRPAVRLTVILFLFLLTGLFCVVSSRADEAPVGRDIGETDSLLYGSRAVNYFTQQEKSGYSQSFGSMSSTSPDSSRIPVPITKEPSIAEGAYYIRCITSPYVYFSTPETEASEIPVAAPEGMEESLFQGENGEGLIRNLQLEILGKDLKPLKVLFDAQGYALFEIPETGQVLGLAADLHDGVNVLPVNRITSYYPSPMPGLTDIYRIRQQWIIEKQEDDSFLIRSAADPRYVLTLDDRFGTQYGNIMLSKENGLETQRFCFESETPRIEPALDAGTYYIRSGTSDWMMLSIGDGIYNDERNIYIWESDQGDGQIFSVEYDDYGFAYIHHNDSSKVLTVRNDTARNGQEIGQYEYEQAPSQQWIIEAREDGGFYIRTALNVSEVMDLTDSITRNGIPILLHWHNGSAAQQWFFHSDPVPSPPYAEIMSTYAQTYSSDTGYLIMVDSSSNHLGVYEGWYGNWTNLFFWDCVTGKWSTPTPLGEFTIFSHLYSFDGNEDSPAWYSVYYASSFLPSYYIHSIIYYQGTWDILDATMSANASHGCIRLYTDNAKWIYDNIPNGTKVVVY